MMPRPGNNNTTVANTLIVFFLSLFLHGSAVAEQSCSDDYHYDPDRWRFEKSGVVVDKSTGLMWMRCTLGADWHEGGCVSNGFAASWMNWKTANDRAQQLSYAGYDDWRLPTIDELESIVASGCVRPSIDLDVFPKTEERSYWTATPYEFNDDYVWKVNFLNGRSGTDLKTSPSYVTRPVRQHLQPQTVTSENLSETEMANSVTTPETAQAVADVTPSSPVHEPIDDSIHDKSNPQHHLLQNPKQALKPLPKSSWGSVDWVAALREGVINPRAELTAQGDMMPMNLNIIMPETLGMPTVKFPHQAHTEWLTCSNCHPSIFYPKEGSNPITMSEILAGEWCGRCHGRVAFSTFECDRCHTGEP